MKAEKGDKNKKNKGKGKAKLRLDNSTVSFYHFIFNYKTCHDMSLVSVPLNPSLNCITI